MNRIKRAVTTGVAVAALGVSAALMVAGPAAAQTTSTACDKGSRSCHFDNIRYGSNGTVTIGWSGNTGHVKMHISLRDSKGVCISGDSTATSFSYKCTSRPTGDYTVSISTFSPLKNTINYSATF